MNQSNLTPPHPTPPTHDIPPHPTTITSPTPPHPPPPLNPVPRCSPSPHPPYAPLSTTRVCHAFRQWMNLMNLVGRRCITL